MYVGVQAYFLTARTRRSQRAFTDPAFAIYSAERLLQCAAAYRFDVTAYCFMPDHVHILLAGTAEDAMLLACFRKWRQATGYRWRQLSGTSLWQEGYWDRVLRSEDALEPCAAYIVQNPVRARLAQKAIEYPFLGSSVLDVRTLAELEVSAPGYWRRR